MKNICLFLAGFLIFSSLNGQNYFPLVEDNKEWNVLQVIYSPPYPWYDTTYYTYSYKFEGDTLINNLTYLKVYRYDTKVLPDWYYYCAIREDQDKKVYVKVWDEFLKYDFDVDVGDTVEIYDFDYPHELFVESIDSVLVDDEYRRRIFLRYVDYSGFTESWIEGIGSNRGVMESGTAGYVGGWTWFLCMHQDGELVYMNPNYTSCYMTNVSITELDASSIKVYPNPASGILIIANLNNLTIESITLFDYRGQSVRDFDAKNNFIDLAGINAGIYLLRLSSQEGEIIKKILIKR